MTTETHETPSLHALELIRSKNEETSVYEYHGNLVFIYSIDEDRYTVVPTDIGGEDSFEVMRKLLLHSMLLFSPMVAVVPVYDYDTKEIVHSYNLNDIFPSWTDIEKDEEISKKTLH